MKRIKFRLCELDPFGCSIQTSAELESHRNRDGLVLNCYKLSLRERLSSFFFGKIYTKTYTYSDPLQEIQMYTYQPPFELEETDV